MTDEPANAFVSRGGLKLQAAIDAFALDVGGFHCADLGCNVGGFVDCLLQRGADRVYAVDTGYGALAWKLRNDRRVVVLERTNALHVDPAELAPPPSRIDLVTIDLAWTPQRHAIAAALRWNPRRIVTLIKPHYEASSGRRGSGRGGPILDEDEAGRVLRTTLDAMPALGAAVLDHVRSPIRGGKSKGRVGNVEYLALLEPR